MTKVYLKKVKTEYSLLTILRILMHEMSEEWQNKMAELLEEYDNTWIFNNMDNIFPCVNFRNEKGRYVKIPDWLLNYRYLNKEKIKEIKKENSK